MSNSMIVISFNSRIGTKNLRDFMSSTPFFSLQGREHY